MVKRHNRRQANVLWQQRRYWTGVSCWWKRETLWWLISAGSCQNSNGRYLKVLIRRLYLCFHSSLCSLRDYWVAEDGAGGEEGRRGEGNIRFPLAALDVTTLIIDLGKQQLRSFGIFLAYEEADLFSFLNKAKGVSLVRKKKKKKDTESCLKLSDGDILSRLRCEASICEFLPEAKGAGEGSTYCTLGFKLL